MKKKIPELLAPAGGMNQLVAAVENGANAVYLGGPLFNARIQADNFTEEKLEQAVDYAHLRDVKVHVTLNTLLKDEELLPALEYAAKLYEMGVDALIVQDLGLAYLLRQYLPDLPLHLSTQGSIYNLSGVKKARELGFSRVVLARELSLAEIQQITDNTSCEVEVFVHGALCICYSGQCQMSRILGRGERSGNRGLCAQPCRLPYKDDKGKTACILSPKDLCTVDDLGELTEAGVTSLKIEGRMKSAEYVAAVTRIYRKYLDYYAKSGKFRVSAEDRRVLMQVFNRGGFTEGYLKGNPGAEFLSGRLPKHQGVFAGTVVKRVPGTNLVDVEPTASLEIGDGIEIRSRELVGNILTYRQERKGGMLRIGDIKGTVRTGDRVYKITDAALMQSLRRSYEEAGPEGTKCKKTVPVCMNLQVRIGQPPVLTVRSSKWSVTVCDESVAAEKARNRVLEKESAERQLSKTGGTPFYVESIKMNLEEGCALPISSLNRLRREALLRLTEEKERAGKRRCREMPRRISFEKTERQKRLAFYFYQGTSFQQFDLDAVKALLKEKELPLRIYVPLRFFVENHLASREEDIVPYILNISKGRLDQYIEENFDKIVEKTKRCGISVGNLGWIREFAAEGVPLYADYGLNLYNQKAVESVVLQGIRQAVPSHERWKIENGPIPLMISEHQFHTSSLTDRKNKLYEIVYNEEGDKSLIFPKGKLPSIKELVRRAEKEEGESRIYIP